MTDKTEPLRDEDGKRKGPNFIVHNCPIRDECWAEIDARTLGTSISDPSAARRTKSKHRSPKLVRPKEQPCGFEATSLWWCGKYKARAISQGLTPPRGDNGGGASQPTGIPVQRILEL